MGSILDEIISDKRNYVAEQKRLYPIELLEKSLFFDSPAVSLKKYLLREDKCGIIAEIKRQSPSKGKINPYIDVEKLSIGYMQSGASALSILTDFPYFGGKDEDLRIARKFNYCPILRKDFLIDQYQIFESKSIGADAILLIARVLTKNEVTEMSKLATQLGMEVLLEVHSIEDLEKWNPSILLVGINSRDLSTFEISMEKSASLVTSLPHETVKIAESGIETPQNILDLRLAGFQGFLIGESFMKTHNPPATLGTWVRALDHSKKS